MWGPLPICMVLRSEGSPGAFASQLGTDAWTKKKQTKKKDGKYNINIAVAGEMVWLRQQMNK